MTVTWLKWHLGEFPKPPRESQEGVSKQDVTKRAEAGRELNRGRGSDDGEERNNGEHRGDQDGPNKEVWSGGDGWCRWQTQTTRVCNGWR